MPDHTTDRRPDQLADRIAVVNGPNLGLLGTREPHLYGRATLVDVEASCAATAARHGLRVVCRQSNHEGELVDAVAELADCVGFVVNAGALTHTSIALRDALSAVGAPIVEVHISNVFAREPFRHRSYLSDIASGVIVGCGVQGYDFAVERVAALIREAR